VSLLAAMAEKEDLKTQRAEKIRREDRDRDAGLGDQTLLTAKGAPSLIALGVVCEDFLCELLARGG
jgi:hypothetical protein